MKKLKILNTLSTIIEETRSAIADVEEWAKKADEKSNPSANFLRSQQKDLGDILARAQTLQRGFLSLPTTSTILPNPPDNQREASTVIAVEFADGTVFYDRLASRTFFLSLHKMGLDGVFALNERLSGVPLVSHTKERRKRVKQHYMEGYYITTTSSTQAKKDMLEKVARALGKDISVQIVPKET